MQIESEQQQSEINKLRDDYEDRQTYQLRLQVMAYKYLVRNMAIPNHIERSLLQVSREQWDVERERMFASHVNYYKNKIEKQDEFKGQMVSLKKRTNDQQIEQGKQMIEQQQGLLGSFWEDNNNYFVGKRRSEIAQLLAKSDLTQSVRTQLRMEQLFLNQKDFYLRLKDKVLGSIQSESVQQFQGRLLERQLLDRNYFKRDRPQRRIESRLSDKFELNMIRHEQERRKRLKIKEFMSAVFAHSLEFFEFHRKKYKHARKRGTGVRAYIEQMEKRRQEAQGKKQRLKFLKENKIDDYVDMIQEMKNERIIQILKQTDEFLRAIGAKVKVQKGDQKNESVDDELNFNGANDNLGQNLKHSNRVYYNITHKVKEQVNRQPTLLDGGELKSYQLSGLEWLVSLYNNHLNGILADEMGLGKTIQTISLVCYLMENKKNYGPFLIIVPLSTLSNWCLEFDKWAPSINKLIYKGSPQARKDIARIMKTTKWNICLTTYEYILKDRLTLAKFEWKYIVIDEGHRMKNVRSKFAYVLGQQYQSERRLLLTGTPLQNNLAELWALLNFLLPKVFQSCEDFEKWFSLPLCRMGGSDKDVGLNEEEQLLIINRLHQVLRPFLLRRVKKEVESELPNKVEYVIKVELSAWQRHIYEQIESRGLLTFDQQSGKTGTRALQNLMMQLRKICNHPYLFMLNLDLSVANDEVWRSSGKFELLDRMLNKLLVTKHRMLIFSQMTQLLDIMEVFMEYRGMRYLRLDGSTKAEDRPLRINLFCQENSPYNIFLLSTRAGGLGLNLQAADTVILFDSDWNPHMDLQAQDRAYRIGQKNEVRVYRLVTATMVEEAILSKAEFKMGLDQMIIQAGMYNQKSTDKERTERLKDFFKQKNRFEEFEAEEIPNDEQLNEWLARSEEEFEIFQEMDRQRYEIERLQYPHFREQNKNGGKTLNYRLIQEDEVPDWLHGKESIAEVEKEYGRGNRQRKQVIYTEELSDLQFMRMLDEGIDPNDADKVQLYKSKLIEEEINNDEQSGAEQEDINYRKLKKIKINSENQSVDEQFSQQKSKRGRKPKKQQEEKIEIFEQ